MHLSANGLYLLSKLHSSYLSTPLIIDQTIRDDFCKMLEQSLKLSITVIQYRLSVVNAVISLWDLNQISYKA